MVVQKTATADGSGNYSFTVSYNWSGTVSASKTGYTFSADKVYTNVLTNQTAQNYTATVITYTVSFSSNGGSTVNSQSINYNTVATQPATPTKTGYTFAGWYSDAGLTAAFNFSTTITANITLYAKWTINAYTVSFNSNGGSTVNSQSINYNTAATQPAAPTKTGYTFAGWFSDAGLTNAFSFSTAITANITLYAKWDYQHLHRFVQQ